MRRSNAAWASRLMVNSTNSASAGGGDGVFVEPDSVRVHGMASIIPLPGEGDVDDGVDRAGVIDS
jgi:hypothetical protein